MRIRKLKPIEERDPYAARVLELFNQETRRLENQKTVKTAMFYANLKTGLVVEKEGEVKA